MDFKVRDIARRIPFRLPRLMLGTRPSMTSIWKRSLQLLRRPDLAQFKKSAERMDGAILIMIFPPNQGFLNRPVDEIPNSQKLEKNVISVL
jgi:hypothetical protein